MEELTYESDKWNKEGFMEEVKRGGQKEEKNKKSFYWEIRMWVHRSGTRHLGCFLGTWKEKYKNTWKKVERCIWKDTGKNLKGYTENLESTG